MSHLMHEMSNIKLSNVPPIYVVPQGVYQYPRVKGET